MAMLFDLLRPAIFALDPERAHGLTVAALKTMPAGPKPVPGALACDVAGLTFPNPVGLAAGFDKNGEVPDAMLGLGFGAVEVGPVVDRRGGVRTIARVRGKPCPPGQFLHHCVEALSQPGELAKHLGESAGELGHDLIGPWRVLHQPMRRTIRGIGCSIETFKKIGWRLFTQGVAQRLTSPRAIATVRLGLGVHKPLLGVDREVKELVTRAAIAGAHIWIEAVIL